MAEHIEELGDKTSRTTTPDFESGKGYYWMKATKQAMINGVSDIMPRKPRRTLAENCFFDAVDRRLSRQSFTVGVAFDKNGKLIKE